MSIAVGTKVRVLQDNDLREPFPVGSVGVIVEPSELSEEYRQEGESVANFLDDEQEYYVRFDEVAASTQKYGSAILVEVIDD